MTWTSLPKLELHLHLEGAAPPALIRDLAREKHIDLSGIFTETGAYAFRDFPHFLKVYEAATSVLTTPRDYGRLTAAVLENCAEHGAIYVESFLSPDFCGGGDLHAWRDYLAEIEDASREAEKTHGIIHRGIVTCIRHFGPDAAKPAALCAAETAGPFIRGFGMGGNETLGHPRDFTWAFDCAREAGLHLTCHAGEWGGAQGIRDTLHHLAPARIGHGVAAHADPALITQLAETAIHLETCPGSNIALGLFPSFAAHPLAKLRQAGVNVSISTDDPPFFHTTLTREYEETARAFDWDEEDFAAINRMALAAAFCDDDTAARVKERLEAR